jgi:hypothetical protein
MKKLLAALAILITVNAYSQNTTTLPAGTNTSTPSIRTKGTDSLHTSWFSFPGIGWNQFYSAAEANLRFENKANKTSTISNSTVQFPSVKAVQDYTYAKAHIDSAVNNARTQVYYASLTSGNTLTNSALQNVNIVDVSRSSADYYSTGSTSPTGNSFYYNPTVGSILFQDSFTSSGEPVKVQYTTTSVSIGGTSVPILTYATMAAIVYPTANCFIVVNTNEDQDGLRWIFYAPSGTTDKIQLQAVASTLNNF